MTVPALGCPRVSRWDLTRHGLSSLPYSPDTGGRVGKGATRGGESLAVYFLFRPNIFQHICGLPTVPINKIHCYTVVLKTIYSIYIIKSSELTK